MALCSGSFNDETLKLLIEDQTGEQHNRQHRCSCGALVFPDFRFGHWYPWRHEVPPETHPLRKNIDELDTER